MDQREFGGEFLFLMRAQQWQPLCALGDDNLARQRSCRAAEGHHGVLVRLYSLLKNFFFHKGEECFFFYSIKGYTRLLDDNNSERL